MWRAIVPITPSKERVSRYPRKTQPRNSFKGFRYRNYTLLIKIQLCSRNDIIYLDCDIFTTIRNLICFSTPITKPTSMWIRS